MTVKAKCTTALLVMASAIALGQAPQGHTYTLDQLFKLATTNNQALKISSAAVDVSLQRIAVAKTQQLPNISASASAFYLGDATIFDPSFANKTTVPMPHFGNSFTVQASQVVFKGKAISSTIEVASLQQQLATLSFEKNRQDIKLLIAGYYLDLFRLRNQQSIYLRNIELTEIRLKHIESMHQQGMVTLNDVIRTKLLLSNLKQVRLQIGNSIDILNSQVTTAVGLPTGEVVIPDTTILATSPTLKSLEAYTTDAAAGYYDIKIAEKNVQLAEKSLAIAKADRMPSLSLFAANSLARPITSRAPAIDMYSNGWQAGATLSFNIASLYNAPRSIKLGRLQVVQWQQAVVLQQQNSQLAVQAAYLRHREAVEQCQTTTVNRQLALENYKIMEKKYLNQLALLIDMLDAANAKLESELQNTNAQISTLFTYYKLLNVTGGL